MPVLAQNNEMHLSTLFFIKKEVIMSNFQLVVYSITFLTSLFLLLLAFSKGLPDFLLHAFGWFLIVFGKVFYLATGVLILYILSPVDLIPLFAGDDWIAGIMALQALGFGYMVNAKGNDLLEESPVRKISE